MFPAVRSPSGLRLPGRARSLFCAAACLLGILCVQAQAEGGRLSAPFSPFGHAERLREALQAQPEARRTSRDYERVLDAYRVIYHENPASSEADASISAVAGLLAEEGRLFQSEKLLRDAIGQYEFLRREYPGSRYRFSALVAEGEIYRADLKELDQARAKFQEFVTDYPRNPLVTQALMEIRQIREEDVSGRRKRHRAAPEFNNVAALADSSSRAAESPLPLPTRSGAAPVQSPSPHGKRLPRVTGIRYWSTPGYTRIAIDLDEQTPYQAARVPRPDRIYFDLRDTRLSPQLMGKSVVVTDGGFLKRIRAAQYSDDVTRIVLDVGSATDYSAFFLPNPWRLIIDIHRDIHRDIPARRNGVAAFNESASVSSGSSRPAFGSHNELESLSSPPPVTDRPGASMAQPDPALMRKTRHLRSATAEPPDGIDLPAMREAEPTAAGERSLVRTLGLKIGRIVLDAGHGGHDCGTLGPGGIQEKDIVLDVTLRLGKLLRRRMGADVIYTRDDDTFIPLQTRTAIANKSRADLFISIHANSSSDPAARGVESYYLNFTTSPEALEVAARENAVSDGSIHELSDLVKKIALRDKIEESREFAADVQNSLYDGLEAGNPGLKDRGVKKAPFVVLIGANMPSILAEISFLTNPDDARELHQAAYRERIAESLYRGVAKYISGLSGVRLAQNGDHPGN